MGRGSDCGLLGWVELGVCGCDVIRWAGWVMESWAEPWSLGVRREGESQG